MQCFLMNVAIKKPHNTAKSSFHVDKQFIQKLIPTSNPEKLEYQTKQLLKKYPNTSKIIFEYEDQQVKNKKKK